MEKVLWNFTEDIKDKSAIFKFYHLNSKHTVRTQCFNAPKLDYEIIQEEEEYPIITQIPFLCDIKDDGFTLYNALMKRKTSWDFKKEALNDLEIEKFLAYSFGNKSQENQLKTYPSGGRLYPIEIYLIPSVKIIGSNKVFKEDNIVRYNVNTRNVELIKKGNANQIDRLISATDIGRFSFNESQFLICLVGNYKMMSKKYHSLTYRLMQNEAGHIGQNIMLTAAALGLNSVPLGGFFEDRINSLIGIEKTKKQTLYVFAIG